MDYSTIPNLVLFEFRAKQIIVSRVKLIPIAIKPAETSLPTFLNHYKFSICKRVSQTSFKATSYSYCISYSKSN